MMSLEELRHSAEQVVQRTQRRLPAEVRPRAEALPVVLEAFPSRELLGEEFEPDILGLFVGDPVGAEPGASGAVPAQIFLFLENILAFADGDLDIFREEVRITYLHEFGHYLGWDEEELQARGLD